MNRNLARAAVAFLAVTAVVVPGRSAHAITTSKTVIQYFLSPHPDDVFQAWSLVQDSSSNYPVFITLTMGESTGYCTDTSMNVQYYGAFDTTTQSGCMGARMASLNNWLDDQSDHDAYLNDYVRAEQAANGYNMTKFVQTAPLGGIDATGSPTVAHMNGCTPAWGSGGCTGTNPSKNTQVPDNLNVADTAADPDASVTAARQVIWYVGATSARVEFNLGDGNLTDAEVLWAFNYVHTNRATFLPLTNEYGVVAAAYSNLGHQYTACSDYSHHDHRAVQEAVYDNRLITDPGRHPQWGNTCGSQTTTVGTDSDALPANGGRANMITSIHYTQNMSQNGNFQNRFRWLKGGGTNVWPSGPDPTGSIIFAQWNYFWGHYVS